MVLIASESIIQKLSNAMCMLSVFEIDLRYVAENLPNSFFHGNKVLSQF